jgi:hypothetical protein
VTPCRAEGNAMATQDGCGGGVRARWAVRYWRRLTNFLGCNYRAPRAVE